MTTAGTTRRPRALAGDTLHVSGGLAVYGLASFAFLALGARALGNGQEYTAVALCWTLINAVGIGLYLPVEQESSRRITARRARGLATASVLRVPVRYVVVSLAILAAAVALLHEPLTEHLFAGVDGVAWCFVAALGGMAVAYLARGVLAGTGRFPRYGAQLAVDGFLRVAGALALTRAGASSAVPFVLVLAAAPVVATGLVLLRSRTLLVSDSASPAEPSVSMLHLVLASLASQALANAGPVAAQLLAGASDTDGAATLVNALTIARIPLFLFAAVQAVFLPRLAGHVARGARAELAWDLRRATGATLAVAAMGVGAAALVGPQAVRLLFGPGFDAGRTEVVLLAASAALFMVVQVLVQGLLALGADALATASWLTGLAAFVVTLTVPGSLTIRVATSLVAGSAAALVAAALLLRHALGVWGGPTDGS